MQRCWHYKCLIRDMTRVNRQLLSLFVCAISLPSSVAAQERVEHAAAGISLDRPAGWHSATLAQVQTNRERVRLSDAQLQDAMVNRSAMPVVVFMKYPEPHAGLNPSVQVTLRPALAGTPVQLLSGALETLRRAFADFRILLPVQRAMVAGRPAAHVRVTYTLHSRSGESFPVMSRMWLVPRGPVMFLIGMSGAQSGDDGCDAEFANVLASMDIQN